MIAVELEDDAVLEPVEPVQNRQAGRDMSQSVAGFLGFVSVLLGGISFALLGLSGMPTPLLALIGSGVGYYVARRLRQQPALRSERRFAKAGFWIGVANLFVVALALVLSSSRSTTINTYG